MSTRCQVQVVQDGLSWDEKVTLYHHTDGYPTYMLPLLGKARKLAGDGYASGRTGMVASFLCAADPGIFEPEDHHQPHGDIEWFYRLVVRNVKDGSLAENAEWYVEVYPIRFTWNGMEEFPTGNERIPLADAIAKAEAIENAKYAEVE